MVASRGRQSKLSAQKKTGRPRGRPPKKVAEAGESAEGVASSTAASTSEEPGGTVKLATKLKKKYFKRPYTLGIAPLPMDFAWDGERPPISKVFWNPRAKPRSHNYPESMEPIEIFLDLMDETIAYWIEAANASGRADCHNWEKLTYAEALAFLSIYYYSCVMRASEYRRYWQKSSLCYSKFVVRQMSYSRFRDIRRVTRTYLVTTPEATAAAVKTDAIHKARGFVEVTLKSFRRKRAPTCHLSLDEQMVAFKGRSPHVVMMKNKPISVGLKFFVIAESQTGYVQYARLAFDKDKFGAEVFGRTFALVFDMLSGSDLNDGISLLDKGHVIYTDNYYTSVGLANALLYRRTYLVGTVRQKSRHLPAGVFFKKKNGKKLHICGDPDRGAAVFRYSRCGRLKFVAWQDNKAVLVLCTLPHYTNEKRVVVRRSKTAANATKTLEVQQPKILRSYTQHMRWVDVWWSAVNLKENLAQQLSRKSFALSGRKPRPTSRGTYRNRLDKSSCHVPALTKRSECVVHMQRKMTTLKCTTCDVPMCGGVCWKRYHSKQYYMLNDPTCPGLIKRSHDML